MKNKYNFNKKLILAFTIATIFLSNTVTAQQLEASKTSSIIPNKMVSPYNKKMDSLHHNTNSKTIKPNCIEINIIKSKKSINKKVAEPQAPKPEEPFTSPASYTFVELNATFYIA